MGASYKHMTLNYIANLNKVKQIKVCFSENSPSKNVNLFFV